MSVILTSQQVLFKNIKEKLPDNISLADDIADLLNVSTDSAYRRIRGEKALSMDELKDICAHYGISIDSLLGIESDSVTFNYKSLSEEQLNFEQYLSSMLEDITNIAAFEEKHIIYSAKDIPIFHYFHFPELATFKLFFWGKTILQFPELENKDFAPDVLDKGLLELGKKILETYIHVPATELWNEETVNVTLKQILFYYESGMLKDKAQAASLMDELSKLIDHIKKQAAEGCKFLPGLKPAKAEGNFQLFYNEVLLLDNSLLITVGDTKMVYVTHNALNYLKTADTQFADQTQKWLENLKSKSSLISGVSEKERNKFFNTMQDKVAQAKDSL